MPNDGATQTFPSASFSDFSSGRYMILGVGPKAGGACRSELMTERTFGSHAEALAYCRSVSGTRRPFIVQIVGDSDGYDSEVF